MQSLNTPKKISAANAYSMNSITTNKKVLIYSCTETEGPTSINLNSVF